MLVAVNGALQQLRGVDASGLVVGNALGSALTNATLVLGIATLVRSGEFSAQWGARDPIALAIALALLAIFGSDGRFQRSEGLVLVVAYAGYLAVVIRGRREETVTEVPSESSETRTLLAIGGGLLLILLSAELVVSNGLALAAAWGVDDGLVGLLLVGAGTSLPKLVLSFGAAARGQTTLSVANLVGSNVFDLLVPIGASSMIHPVGIGRESLVLDLPATAAAHVIALVLLRSGWARTRVAAALVGLFVLYAVSRIVVST